MKRLTIKRSFILLLGLGLVLYVQLNLFTVRVSAQDPDTPTPVSTTVTVADTPTATATATPDPSPTAGVPIAPTPIATPVRIVRFAVDDEDGDIDNGDCVLFSWSVRGDIAWVEFDRDDDDLDPILVSDIGERSECPTEDSEYQLKVAWLDGTNTDQEIDIDVRENSSSDGGTGSSSSGGGDTSANTGGQPASGPFVAVTPILFQDISVAPSGVLETINTLPETGDLKEEDGPGSVPHWPVWFVLAGGIGAFVITQLVVVRLAFFKKLGWQAVLAICISSKDKPDNNKT